MEYKEGEEEIKVELQPLKSCFEVNSRWVIKFTDVTKQTN